MAEWQATGAQVNSLRYRFERVKAEGIILSSKPTRYIKGLVSIIIPTFNRADYVVEAIQSAQAQTYQARQIIVIDDGSCDDTAQRVAEIEGVEYYYQTNKGQGAARNYGLSLAQGEYIASLDSDDLWETDFLSRSVSCLEAFHLDFVFTNWDKIKLGELYPSEWLRDGKWQRYRTNRQGDWFLLTPEQVRRLFLDICPAPSSSLLVRRSSIVSGWGERMLIADDWYLLLEIALHRSCRAAFTLTQRWQKRVDGKNVYDGQPAIETLRKLYLHDQRSFRADFKALLSLSEQRRLARREHKYRLLLSLRIALNSNLATRLRVPVMIAPLRLVVRWMQREGLSWRKRRFIEIQRN
jgi:glycosyltransferase involved in cell wall biosynthesis